MTELYSTCCGYNHDERFHYDEEYNQGICVFCKDHATFEEYDEEEKN